MIVFGWICFTQVPISLCCRHYTRTRINACVTHTKRRRRSKRKQQSVGFVELTRCTCVCLMRPVHFGNRQITLTTHIFTAQRCKSKKIIIEHKRLIEYTYMKLRDYCGSRRTDSSTCMNGVTSFLFAWILQVLQIKQRSYNQNINTIDEKYKNGIAQITNIHF